MSETIRGATALFFALALASCGQQQAAPPAPAATTHTEATRTLPEQNQSLPDRPAWSAAYIGKSLASALSGAGECVGNNDGAIVRFNGFVHGTRVIGWGYDTRARQAVQRVVLVDAQNTIVGAGEGGLSRPDVPSRVHTVDSPNTGWSAYTTLTSGTVDAYGLTTSDGGLCRLGRATF